MLARHPTTIRRRILRTKSQPTNLVTVLIALMMGAAPTSRSLLADDIITDSQRKTAEPANATGAPVANAEKTETASDTNEQSEESPEVELMYSCKVTDQETGRGIPNAQVTVTRLNNGVVTETKHTTDARGKYEFAISAEQQVDGSLRISINVEHVDYLPAKTGALLNEIQKNEKLGEPPFFQEIKLKSLDLVTGTVVSPEGQPLARIKVQGFSRAGMVPNRSPGNSFNANSTDENGRFKLTLRRDRDCMISIFPKDYSPVEKFIAKQRGDLGVFKLTPGIGISGVLKSIDGKVVPGVAINAQYSGPRNNGGLPVITSFRRGTLTDADGQFSFAPLPPGQYEIAPSEFSDDPIEGRRRGGPTGTGVFVREMIVIKDGIEPQRVEIQAVPFVLFSGRFFDSQGKQKGGTSITIRGRFDGQPWRSTEAAKSDGSFAIHIPHGLQQTIVQTLSGAESSVRYRHGPDQAIKNTTNPLISLGSMNDDVEGFEIITYRSPTVSVSALDEDKKPVPDFQVSARYFLQDQPDSKAGSQTNLFFRRPADDRWQTRSMLPDEAATFTVTAPGYESASETLTLPEGATKDLVFTLKKSATEKQTPSSKEE